MNASSLSAWPSGPILALSILLTSGTLLAFDALAARDPFLPPENLLCDPAASVAGPPQLRGIIGRQEDYRAWLVADSGKGRLWQPLAWPHPEWQLQDVSASGVTLRSAKACRPSLTMNLAGSPYVP